MPERRDELDGPVADRDQFGPELGHRYMEIRRGAAGEATDSRISPIFSGKAAQKGDEVRGFASSVDMGQA